MKPIFKNVIASVFVFLLGFSHGQGVYANEAFVPELQPDSEYLPEEVVGIQMRALGNNNKPFSDAGIELTFRFASPRNLVNTGPLEKFSQLFSIPAYQPMLNHSELVVGSAKLEQRKAYVPVSIKSIDGNMMGYMFILGKQTEEPCTDCWMTDSVIPIRLDSTGKPLVM